MGIDSHGNNGHSHSNAGCFPFLPIPIPNFVTNSHYHGNSMGFPLESHGIPIPIGNPNPMVISTIATRSCASECVYSRAGVTTLTLIPLSTSSSTDQNSSLPASSSSSSSAAAAAAAAAAASGAVYQQQAALSSTRKPNLVAVSERTFSLLISSRGI